MPLHPLAIDRFASALLDDMVPGDWTTMRDVVSDLVAAFRAQHGRGRTEVRPGPDAREVVGDLIAKMDAPPVGSALQARLWTLSDRPKHRAEGRDWLVANPEAAAAAGGRFDDENLLFLAEAPVTDDDETALPPTLRFTATFDEAAGVWTASGPDGIAAEAPTKPELLELLAAAAAGAVEGRHGRVGRSTVIVDWREAGRVHSTTLSVGLPPEG